VRTFHGYLQEVSLRRRPELNPKLWDADRLRPDVREALLRFGKVWQGFAKIPDRLVQDITLVGGNASYYYTDGSDLDVHLLIDKAQLGYGEIVDEFLRDRKTLWGLKHKVTVKGYPVEPYAQDVKELSPVGQGVYSLVMDDWVQRPALSEYDPEQDPNLGRKVRHWQRLVDKTVDQDLGPDQAYSLRERIKLMRKAGITRGGELNPSNLVFKDLRNTGHLTKLTEYLRGRSDQSLSLR
jgi:hypothetical protein